MGGRRQSLVASKCFISIMGGSKYYQREYWSSEMPHYCGISYFLI